MVIAAVIGFCVLVLVLAFLLPRLSQYVQRGGQKPLGLAGRAGGKAPGKAGEVAQKSFGKASQAISKSGSKGRQGRAKAPF
jgi:hypothetical protein